MRTLIRPAMISPCAGAIDYRGGSRLLKSTSIASQANKNGVLATTLPTQPVPVIRQHPEEPVRELSLIRWGLTPSWAKDPSIAAGMINARSETASAKPAFRDAWKFRRCLIPADGFHEWQKTGQAKQRNVLKSMEGSCSRWREYGIAGATKVATR